jgi:hypothetical protein
MIFRETTQGHFSGYPHVATVFAGILIASPVAGFRPILALRLETTGFPNRYKPFRFHMPPMRSRNFLAS